MVNDYLQRLVEYYNKELNMKVSPDSRDQRLQMALALDQKGKQWEAMELMVGRRIGSEEKTYAFLLVQKMMFPQDTVKFYTGFPESK